MISVLADATTIALFVLAICLVLSLAGVIVAFAIRVMRKLLQNDSCTSSNKQS